MQSKVNTSPLQVFFHSFTVFLFLPISISHLRLCHSTTNTALCILPSLPYRSSKRVLFPPSRFLLIFLLFLPTILCSLFSQVLVTPLFSCPYSPFLLFTSLSSLKISFSSSHSPVSFLQPFLTLSIPSSLHFSITFLLSLSCVLFLVCSLHFPFFPPILSPYLLFLSYPPIPTVILCFFLFPTLPIPSTHHTSPYPSFPSIPPIPLSSCTSSPFPTLPIHSSHLSSPYPSFPSILPIPVVILYFFPFPLSSFHSTEARVQVWQCWC